MVNHADLEFFNPVAHTKVNNAGWSPGLSTCSCSWVGVVFEAHMIAMQATYDVLLKEHEIEEEE